MSALMMIASTEVEVLNQPERRRHWSDEQKVAIVKEMMRPGASATRVARRHGISTGLLYTWRRLVLSGEIPATPSAGEGAGFIPVRVVETADVPHHADPPDPKGSARSGEIVIELAGGHRLRVDRQVDAEARRRVVQVLEGA
jgi:transposase